MNPGGAKEEAAGGKNGADDTDRPLLLPNDETVRSSSPIGGKELCEVIGGAAVTGGAWFVYMEYWLTKAGVD